MTSQQTRRSFCKTVVVGGLLAKTRFGLAAERPVGLSLGIGNYGMKSYKVEDAIRLVSEIGFDAMELTLLPEWNSAPEKLSKERRSTLKRLLEDQHLSLMSFMEHLIPSDDQVEHQKSIDRLKQAAELGHDLSPDAPPLIQTVLGGGKWPEKKPGTMLTWC